MYRKKKARRARGLGSDPGLDSAIPHSSNSSGSIRQKASFFTVTVKKLGTLAGMLRFTYSGDIDELRTFHFYKKKFLNLNAEIGIRGDLQWKKLSSERMFMTNLNVVQTVSLRVNSVI